MSSTIYDKTVQTLHAALEYTYNQALNGRPCPDRSDAVRLTWQLVELASHAIQERE